MHCFWKLAIFQAGLFFEAADRLIFCLEVPSLQPQNLVAKAINSIGNNAGLVIQIRHRLKLLGDLSRIIRLAALLGQIDLGDLRLSIMSF